jgi:hypothetical protein
MVENGQLPAWLAELRDEQLGEQLQEQPPIAEALPEQIGQADVAEGPQEQVGPTDTLDDLREQMIQAEEEFEAEERQKTSLARSFQNLAPAQRLVLAILLFLNVAVCGCMGLVMAGRIVLPF